MTRVPAIVPSVCDQETLHFLLDVASKEVFRMMVGCELQPAAEAHCKAAEFTAMVGLAGELCGVLSVRCSQSSASQVAALMLDLAPETAAEHAWDALGELANMIAGNFKNKLNGASDRCMLSIPTVITGADYTFRSVDVASPPWNCWSRWPILPAATESSLWMQNLGRSRTHS
ncbi:MAG: hypothetical protein DMG95_06405 [Acidobacteria bacterium]|nr:MAG: hypothetical protein DMG95_06405 [Acidobacteriota bacterium]